MRTIYGVDRLEHTHYLFYDSHSLKCPDIVRIKTVLFMFNAYNNNLPTNLQNLFVKRTPLHSAHRTHQCLREHLRTNIRAMSLPVIGVKLWNSLSTSLTSVRSLYTFKRVYTNTLLSNYVENV